MCEACEKVIYCVFSSSKSHWDTRCSTQNVFNSKLAMHQHFLCLWTLLKNFFRLKSKIIYNYSHFFLISWLETVEYIPSPFPGEMRMYSLKTKYYSTYLPRATPHKNCVLIILFWHNSIFVIWLEMKKIRTCSFISSILTTPSLTSTPHSSHQRPPSVGMPRHALRRRMPKIFPSALA